MAVRRMMKGVAAPLALACLLMAGCAGERREKPVSAAEAEGYLLKGQELLAEGKTDSARATQSPLPTSTVSSRNTP